MDRKQPAYKNWTVLLVSCSREKRQRVFLVAMAGAAARLLAAVQEFPLHANREAAPIADPYVEQVPDLRRTILQGDR